MPMKRLLFLCRWDTLALVLLLQPVSAWAAAAPTTLIEYGAGTLAVPFKAVNAAFEVAHPEIRVQAQFGGSVKLAEQITDLQQPADVLAVADYSVIPRQLYTAADSKAYAD